MVTLKDGHFLVFAQHDDGTPAGSRQLEDEPYIGDTYYTGLSERYEIAKVEILEAGISYRVTLVEEFDPKPERDHYGRRIP